MLWARASSSPTPSAASLPCLANAAGETPRRELLRTGWREVREILSLWLGCSRPPAGQQPVLPVPLQKAVGLSSQPWVLLS